jgi:hypothetical protein
MSSANATSEGIIVNDAKDEPAEPDSLAQVPPAQADIAATNTAQDSPQASGRTISKQAKSSSASRSRSAPIGDATAFSVSEEDWLASIPRPGHYDALIIHAWINPKSDITYLNVEYRIVDHDEQPYTVVEMVVLDAKQTNPRHSQSAKGKGRVKAIMEANGKPLEFRDIQAVPLALVGCRVRIAVGHKNTGDLPAPAIQGIVGPALPERRET